MNILSLNFVSSSDSYPEYACIVDEYGTIKSADWDLIHTGLDEGWLIYLCSLVVGEEVQYYYKRA